MKTSTTSAVLPCTPDILWGAFLNESYLRALYLDELESRAFAVLEIGDASRKLRIVPKMNLPAPVAKLIGESFAKAIAAGPTASRSKQRSSASAASSNPASKKSYSAAAPRSTRSSRNGSSTAPHEHRHQTSLRAAPSQRRPARRRRPPVAARPLQGPRPDAEALRKEIGRRKATFLYATKAEAHNHAQLLEAYLEKL